MMDIDVFIGNSADTRKPGTQTQIGFNPDEPNELSLNDNGDGTFIQMSQEIRYTTFEIGDDPRTIYDGNTALAWDVTMVDIDDDGFVEIIEVNN